MIYYSFQQKYRQSCVDPLVFFWQCRREHKSQCWEMGWNEQSASLWQQVSRNYVRSSPCRWEFYFKNIKGRCISQWVVKGSRNIFLPKECCLLKHGTFMAHRQVVSTLVCCHWLLSKNTINSSTCKGDRIRWKMLSIEKHFMRNLNICNCFAIKIVINK